MQRFYKKNFTFQATRYEVYQDGECIANGQIFTQILAKVYPKSTLDEIHFRLIDNVYPRIVDQFSFFCIDDAALASPDRISYYAMSDFNPVVPCVCQLFGEDDRLLCVRFAMTNPDKLIEFYGRDTLMDPLFDSLI